MKDPSNSTEMRKNTVGKITEYFVNQLKENANLPS